VGNLAYRIFVRRLYSEPRYATPYSLHEPGSPPEPSHWQVPEQAAAEEVACAS